MFIFAISVWGIRIVLNKFKNENLQSDLAVESKQKSTEHSEELNIFEDEKDSEIHEQVESVETAAQPPAVGNAEEKKAHGAGSTKPAVKNNVPVVVLDAGHGGYDSGTIGSGGSREKDNTLPVALAVGNILEKKGTKIIYTRKSDKVSWPSVVKQDLLTRASISNDADADLFISIHNNSSEYNSIRGTETYYNSISIKGKTLAGLIQKQIVKDLKTIDRGIRTEDYSVLRNVKAPSVIVELGYLSNKNEEAILTSASYQSRFASSIAQAVLKYLNIK